MLIHPLSTEKTTKMSSERKYAFRVNVHENKIEIAKEAELLYKVKVEKVHILWVKSKARNLGRSKGRTDRFKKAIITLQKGFKIEV